MKGRVTRDHLKQLQLCEMLVGDKSGPKGRCYALAVMPVRINDRKVQVCQTHSRPLKEARELMLQRSNAESAQRECKKDQPESPSGSIVLTDL